MGLGIIAKGLTEARALISQTGGRIKDRIALHRQIGVELVKWIDRNFQAEGSEKKWAPLASSTLFGRRQSGRGAKILQNNGILRASVTYQASADKVVVGFPENSVAEYHHFGTRPYIIRPKNAKALMFFMPPMSGLGGAGQLTSFVRRQSGTPKIGIVSAKSIKGAGLRAPKGKGDIQSVMFRMEVHHPGLKARPLLPTPPLAEQLVNQTIQNYLLKL
jgi:phage gpG-like protein